MPKITKIILTGFAILISAAAIYWFVFKPLLAKVSDTAAQIDIKKTELQLIKGKVAHLSELQETLHNAQTADRSNIPNIPARLTLAEIYSQLDSLSFTSGVKVKRISTKDNFEQFSKEPCLQYIAINLEGTAYFSQVINFLDLIAKSPFLVQVEKMDLSSISKGSKPRLQFKITLDVFEYSPVR